MMGKLYPGNAGKGKGPQVEFLWIIQLIEANLNWILKLIWGYYLNRAINNAGAYDDAQFAVPGQTCCSAVVNKVCCLISYVSSKSAGQ